MKRQAEAQIAKKKPKMDDDLEYEPDSEDERLTNAGVLFPHKFNIDIPFARSEWADIVRTTLEVDKELKPTIVRRTLEAKDGVLHVTYEALEVRMLRTVVSSFFDMLLLTIDTIKAFGEQEQLPA